MSAVYSRRNMGDARWVDNMGMQDERCEMLVTVGNDKTIVMTGATCLCHSTCAMQVLTLQEGTVPLISMAFLMEDPTRSRTHPPTRVATTAVTMVTPPKVRSIDSRPTPNSSCAACTNRLVKRLGAGSKGGARGEGGIC